MDLPIHKQGAHHVVVFAVVRIDFPLVASNPRSGFMVVRIHRDQAAAVADAERLNELNRDKGCEYFVQSTRMAKGQPLP